MVVEDVLHIKGRGTVLVGDLPTDSVFRSGEIVRVLRKNAPVLTSSAYVELHTRRGKTGLSLSAFDADANPVMLSKPFSDRSGSLRCRAGAEHEGCAQTVVGLNGEGPPG